MTNDKTNKNFIGVSVTILASKALGFVRDMVIAASIGTSRLADVYTQVFGISSLLFTSIGMAISSVNIPNLTHYSLNESAEKRREYAAGLFAQITLLAALVSVLGILFAPVAAKLILPGLDSGTAGVAASLTRIMFPTLIFICLAYITSGILQVHKHFLISSLISIPFNLLIITALLIWKNDIFVLGYVTTIGWLLQFLVQLPVLLKEKYRFSLKLHFENPHTREVYMKLLPILLGNAALQLCLITGRAFASHLDEGSGAALSFGSTLFTTITSVFIVAMSTVTFPDLSKYCLERDFDRLKGLLKYIFKVLFLILVPYILFVTLYSRDIIQLVYQRGIFTDRSTDMTSEAFLFYSFCIAGYVSQEIFNRVYYALKKYNTPMKLSLICITINLVLVALVYKSYGIAGIAASTAVSFLVYAVLMGISIRKEIGNFLGRDFIGFLARLALCSAGILAVSVLFGLLKLGGVVGSLLLPLAVGAAVYLVLAYLTGILKETILRRGEL